MLGSPVPRLGWLAMSWVAWSAFILSVVTLPQGVASSRLGSAVLEDADGGRWRRLPRPAPNGDEWLCGVRSERSWEVAMVGGHVRISERALTSRRRDHLPVPFDESDMPAVPQPRRYVLRVESGWLVALSAGEFGGSVWWVDERGAERRQLLRGNVEALESVGGRRLAVVGLAHAGTDSGEIWELIEGADGEWRARWVGDLGSAPQAIAGAPDGTVLVLTNRAGLRRVQGTDRPERIAEVTYAGLQPRSMAISESGEIYIGMNRFVVRLTPTQGSYQEAWFVPEGCQRFRMTEDSCTCSASDRPGRE